MNELETMSRDQMEGYARALTDVGDQFNAILARTGELDARERLVGFREAQVRVEGSLIVLAYLVALGFPVLLMWGPPFWGAHEVIWGGLLVAAGNVGLWIRSRQFKRAELGGQDG